MKCVLWVASFISIHCSHLEILSPFTDAKKEDAKNTSIGKKIVSNEAHYFYPFSVNPENYNIYTNEIEGLEGYTKEAYDAFKEGCLVAATAYNTNSKAGCENELAIFVECKESSKLYLANLDEYINFKKGEEKDVIDLSELMQILNKDEVKKEIEKQTAMNIIKIDLVAKGIHMNEE